MPMFVAGLLLLWLSSILLRGFMRANPAVVADRLRKAGGWVVLGLALYMMLRGEWNVALGAAGFGFWMLGTSSGGMLRQFSPSNWNRSATRRRAGASRVRSAAIETTLDQSTGQITGFCLAGPFAGRALGDLSPTDGVGLYRWCLGADPEGARLLETYFDRRFPGWRQAADDRANDGRAEAGFRRERAARMPDRVAYQILGLAEGASGEDITRAHRRLMKKHHPDHGGTTEMAARVNEAKDVLMRRHP